LYDRRKTNTGRPDGKFEPFYKELGGLLEEYGKAAEERRSSQTAHMPVAISVAQLIKKVVLCFIICLYCVIDNCF